MKTRLELTGERRKALIRAIQEWFREHHDDDIGDLKASLLLDFFLQEIGPPVYNQAIRDAQAFLQDKLVDLEGVLYEPERDPSRDPSGG